MKDHGTFHKVGSEHLDRYVNEFAGHHNLRSQDTLVKMAAMARGIVGKRLRFQDLRAPVAAGSDVF
ncbi:MAG: hypothetical protein OXF11_00585 [Deltaproteobacteria bacterium]|nr:hypothetical protein [Deltaproteobacteria bacterium]